MGRELQAATRLVSQEVTAKTEKRIVGEYVTKDGAPAITIYQIINDRGQVTYDHDVMRDKFHCPPFHNRSDYHEVFTKVNAYLKTKRGWKAVKPLPEHEPSHHVEPTRYEFHVEFLDTNTGRTGKLDHEVKARNRFDAFTELLAGLKRSGGMDVVHRITCTEHK
jgi:hypothetical protein